MSHNPLVSMGNQSTHTHARKHTHPHTQMHFQVLELLYSFPVLTVLFLVGLFRMWTLPVIDIVHGYIGTVLSLPNTV